MTLNEIKQTPLFKANAPLVAKAFGEQYVEEFARELQIAAEGYQYLGSHAHWPVWVKFNFNRTSIDDFHWESTPQGFCVWSKFNGAIREVGI